MYSSVCQEGLERSWRGGEEGVTCHDEMHRGERSRVWSALPTGLPLSVCGNQSYPPQRTQSLGQGPCLMYASLLTLASTCAKEQKEASWVYSLDGFTLSAAGCKNGWKNEGFFWGRECCKSNRWSSILFRLHLSQALGEKKNSLQKYSKWIWCSACTFYLLAVIKVVGKCADLG